jgi:proline iminopeptidase
VIVEVDGASLSCTVADGDGPACLFLCSYGTAPVDRQTPPPLRANVRPVFVDLRGTGASTGAAAELTFEVLAADLGAVRDAIDAERTVLFGHSIVSVLAIEAGIRLGLPVIATGAPPFGDMRRLMPLGQAFFEAEADDERKQILRDNLAALPPGTPPAAAVFAQTPMRFYDPRFDAMSLFVGAQPSPAFLAHVMGTLCATWEAPALVPAPLLLGHGRHDYVVPHTLWDRKIPDGATFHLFEKSGHQPFIEEPDEFARVVGAWL